MKDTIINRETRALKPDAQPFDEIRIVTVPRYKTSGLSGDEWRISARADFYRKGNIVHSFDAGSVEAAVNMLSYHWMRACDDGKGYFAGEGNVCDQEGCSEPATVTYRVLKRFSRDNPYEWNEPITDLTVRKFCERHSKRGNANYDDSDSNYELLSGSTQSPRSSDVSPSGFAGVVTLDQIDKLGSILPPHD